MSTEVQSARPTQVPQGYYENDRPELTRFVPETARRILEIGCGNGAVGGALKMRQPCHVTGIEYVPAAADIAATRVDRILIGDCEQMDFTAVFEQGEFDCLIAGDVLEHLRDPEWLLRRLKPFLAPDATVITSIPNVRHISVLAQAIQGHWTYEDAGILDRTHLRFFTRREIDKMLANLGFALEDRVSLNDGYLQTWQNAGCPEVITAGPATISLPREEMRELFVIQWVSRARAHPSELAPAFYLAGVKLMENGQLVDAIEHLESAVWSQPDQADFHNALGAAYFEHGLVEQGIKTLRRAVELAPGNVDIRANLDEALALAAREQAA